MKASVIKKIRNKMQTFIIIRSFGMFGDFSDYNGADYELTYGNEVMGRTAKEAAERYMKRKGTTEDFSRTDNRAEVSNKMFAKLRIVPKEKPYNRFVTYWR
jgi:hypothetical protein